MMLLAAAGAGHDVIATAMRAALAEAAALGST